MTAVLALLDFEGQAVRVLDKDGDPWFVATDVAKILGYRDAADLTRLLDHDEKGTQIVRTLGGDQEASTISEPGLYRAIVQRRASKALPAEKRDAIARFQRWLFHDVLPSIRKTGSYAAPAAEPQRITPPSPRETRLWLKQSLELGALRGLAGAQLAIYASRVTQAATGFDALTDTGGSDMIAPTNDRLITPTAIGKELGISAIRVNLVLQEADLHEGGPGEWRPTEAGKAEGGRMVDVDRSNGTGSAQQLKWPVSTIETVRSRMREPPHGCGLSLVEGGLV